MKIKDPCGGVTPVAVASGQLLKYVHVPKLQVIMLVYMIIETQEKPVLIKIIINYLFAKIDMHFIIYHQ